MVKNCPNCDSHIHLLFDRVEVTFKCPSCGFSFLWRGLPAAAAAAWNDRTAGSAVSHKLKHFKLKKGGMK